MNGIERIAKERKRQISSEGWTPSHDDLHTDGELALAAACYAVPNEKIIWPWEECWDKRAKHSRIRQLEIAGALIAAEIDRLDRLEEEEKC